MLYPFVWNGIDGSGGGGGGGPSFGVIIPDAGTNPEALVDSDYLTIKSNEPSNFFFTGDSGTNTLTLDIKTSSSSQNGLLSSTDWSTFNSKQPSDQQLTDLAALSYTGNALKVIRVNGAENNLELSAISATPTIGDSISGGTAKEVLYTDNSGDLFSDSQFLRDSVSKEFKQARLVTLDQIQKDILLAAPPTLSTGEVIIFSDPSTFAITAKGVVISTTGSNVLITLLSGVVSPADLYENEGNTDSGVVVSLTSATVPTSYEVGFISDDILPDLGISGNASYLNGDNHAIISGWADLSSFLSPQFALIDYVSTPSGNATKVITHDSIAFSVSDNSNSEGSLDLSLTEASLKVVSSSSIVSELNIKDGVASYSLKGLTYKLPANSYASPPTAGQILKVNSVVSDVVTFELANISGTGITSINGQTGLAQTISVGTSGTDVNIDNTTPDETIINIPDASYTTRGILSTGLQYLHGEKSFSLTLNDYNNFSANLGAISVIQNTYNNPDDFTIAFYPQTIIADDEDHDGNIVGGLISATQQGDGDINGILAGIAFTAAHGGSGVVQFLLGVSGAVNTEAMSTGDVIQALGASLSVDHEGSGMISTAVGIAGAVTTFGTGGVSNGTSFLSVIEKDIGASGDIQDGYSLFCDTNDAINKYGVVIDVEGTKNTLHQLTLKAALDVVPSTLTDASTIAIDAKLSNIFDITLLGSDTLGNPTNAQDGQEIIFRIRQDVVGGRVLTLDSKYRFGTTLPSVAFSITANALDYLTVRYNLADDTFDVIDFKGGF